MSPRCFLGRRRGREEITAKRDALWAEVESGGEVERGGGLARHVGE